MKIIFDYNRTLLNPETDSLYQGTFELLKKLSPKNELYLVSKNEPGRRERLEELNIAQFFNKINFVDKKTTALFKELVGDSSEVIVIGDRVKEEISIGNQLGMITIWVQQGKFASELPTNKQERPRYIVKNIESLSDLIAKYEK
ncbi:MAG: hypothetical protein RLZZ230_268 [Candidatus Parcubacteria bacterium]|jgi:FMN phosphatase YigB (HAD superfamily)